jgi:uncharacterized membrane protein (UPF0127 family)
MSEKQIVRGLLLLLALPVCLLAEPTPNQTPALEDVDAPFSSAGLPTMNLSVGGKSITVEVANTIGTRQQGLMFRNSLGKDNGMLFVFPDSLPRNFWMKNATIPLSIAFLDSQGVILNIVDEMKPLTDTLYPSQGNAQFALEMTTGWFKAEGIKPGAAIPEVLKAPQDPNKEMENFIYPPAYSPSVPTGIPLGVRVYQNGGVVVKDGEKVVAMVEGDFSFPGDKIDKHFHFDEGHTQNLSDLEACAQVGDGSKATLSGFLRKRQNGFDMEYTLTPSKNFDVHLVDAYVRLNYEDWKGSSFQLGTRWYGVTAEDFGAFKNYFQCLDFLGPSKIYPGLCMEITGNDEMGSSVSDNRFIGQPCFAFHLEPNKEPPQLWKWKEGDKKQLDFTVLFNRPVSISDQIYPLREFEDIRTAMLKKPFTVLPATMTPTAAPQENIASEPDYSVPADAKKVHYYSDEKGGYHLFVPAEFLVSGKSYKGCLNFDTGITTENGDINITHDFFNRLDLKNAQKIKVAESVVNSFAGGFSHRENDEYSAAPDGQTAGTADKIKVKIGDLELDNPELFTNQSLEDVYVHFSDDSAAFYKDYPVVGAATFQWMKKYLISIDYRNREIYFRPLDSKQRTFFETKPLKVFKGVVIGEGLYLPIEINKTIRGLGSVDTGCPAVLLDSDVVNISCFPIQSYSVGGYDVTEKLEKTKPTLFKNLRYQCFIGNIGNNFFENSFITIDPRDQKVYVEK